MSQDRSAYSDENQRIFTGPNLAATHYALLGLAPSASVQEIRRAYRELSKIYHPDTTDLPAAIAIQKFQQLNEAYATLSSPQRRLTYDQKIGFSQIHVIQSPQIHRTVAQTRSVKVSSTYLDPSDRPLSPGELFALFLLGITFVACLVLAVIVGLTRGETILHPSLSSSPAIVQPAVTPSNGQDTRQELLPSDQSTEQLLPPVDQAQDSSSDDQRIDLEPLPAAEQTQDSVTDLSGPA